MNFILIGYRASGKTSVGRKLAGLLQRPFYDTDALIRQQTGRTVKEIVAAGGWPAFRQAEKTVIAGLAGQDGAVIALGGGAVLDRSNAEVLKPLGFFIWLQAGKETIQERLRGDGVNAEQRPSLLPPGNGDDGEILRQRTPVYEALADLIIDTSGKSIEAVTGGVLAHVKKFEGLDEDGAGIFPRGPRKEKGCRETR